VLLPAAGAAAKALGQPDAKSTFSYGTLTNGKVINNGHTLQVVLPAGFTSDVQIPIKGELLRHPAGRDGASTQQAVSCIVCCTAVCAAHQSSPRRMLHKASHHALLSTQCCSSIPT
jgi:hypothetical protein